MNVNADTYVPRSSNGRVDIMKKYVEPNTKNLFAMYDKIPSAQQSTNYREPTAGLWDETLLSLLFKTVSAQGCIEGQITSMLLGNKTRTC